MSKRSPKALVLRHKYLFMSNVFYAPGEWTSRELSAHLGFDESIGSRIATEHGEYFRRVKPQIPRMGPRSNMVMSDVFFDAHDVLHQQIVSALGRTHRCLYDQAVSERQKAPGSVSELVDPQLAHYANFIGRAALLGEVIDLSSHLSGWLGGEFGWRLLIDVEANPDLADTAMLAGER